MIMTMVDYDLASSNVLFLDSKFYLKGILVWPCNDNPITLKRKQNTKRTRNK